MAMDIDRFVEERKDRWRRLEEVLSRAESSTEQELGPEGMRELGEGITQRAHYAMQRIGQIPGIRAPLFDSYHFKEFVINCDGTGRTIQEINAALRAHDIFGGHDLSQEFPDLGQSALYCVTEVHTKADIDRLVAALREVVA